MFLKLIVINVGGCQLNWYGSGYVPVVGFEKRKLLMNLGLHKVKGSS
jgi:hypothetical protein